MTLLTFGLFVLAPLQVTPKPDVPPASIWDRLKIEAEGRMRGEATVDNVDSGSPTSPTSGMEIDDRYRGRMRFRLGARYALMENVNLGARFSTASDGGGGNATDANNPHWDFGDGDGFSGAGIVMDRYYLDWAACDQFHLVVGKQPHAFVVPPIYGDFLWDADISPAGVTATWKPAAGKDFSYDVRAAAYVATEVSADEDPKMWGAQGNFTLPLKQVKLQESVAIYDWGDTSGTAVVGNQGNSATTKDFLVFDDILAATFNAGQTYEMSAYLEFMHNLGESESGLAAGAQFGASSWKRNNFNAFWVFYALDGDSVFSPVAQDDTPVAGTGLNDGDGDGMAGVIVGGTYYLRDNIALKLWALTSNPEGAEDHPTRLRLDLDFRIQ